MTEDGVRFILVLPVEGSLWEYYYSVESMPQLYRHLMVVLQRSTSSGTQIPRIAYPQIPGISERADTVMSGRLLKPADATRNRLGPVN